MWTPGRLVSKNVSTSGSSTPRSADPNTSRIAPTGHSAAQRPWPMQWEAPISVATPSTSPRIFPSGQALRHDPLPMQMSGSITGCREAGVVSSRRSASSRVARARRPSSQRRRLCTPTISAAAATAIATQ